MEHNSISSNVRKAERAFLRKAWWWFPLLGWGMALVVGGPFWRWVAGESPLPLDGHTLLTWRSWVGAGGGLLVPLVWRGLLNIRISTAGVVLSLGLAVGVVEGLLRSDTFQVPMWLAARARLAPDQHFMREVCYVRLEEAAGRDSASPGVILVGSSQVLCGVDDHLLREMLQPIPVIRRAVFGTTPLKALAMMAYVPYVPGDICVQYLSELDFTNQEEFPHSWFRPFASWQTWSDVVRCISPRARFGYWRRAVDYLLAATFESWRDRDFIRQIAIHFWKSGNTGDAPSGKEDLPAMFEQARSHLTLMPTEWKAFHAYAERLEEMGVRMLVFEGDVNPRLHSEHRLRMKQKVREDVSSFATGPARRYVSLEEQGLGLSADDWADFGHLNATGREKLTRRMARELVPR